MARLNVNGREARKTINNVRNTHITKKKISRNNDYRRSRRHRTRNEKVRRNAASEMETADLSIRNGKPGTLV